MSNTEYVNTIAPLLLRQLIEEGGNEIQVISKLNELKKELLTVLEMMEG